jgi:uncharacterized SAM-binding protein YcdF (DUF218 family)
MCLLGCQAVLTAAANSSADRHWETRVILKAIAIALVVPPTSLVFVALLGLTVHRYHRPVGHFMAWFGLLVLLILGMPVVGNALLVTLEQDLPLTPPPGLPPQAIVVLGGDVQHARDGVLTQHIGPRSLERVRTAALLYRRTGLPVLMAGGSINKDVRPVSVLMANSLMEDFQLPVRWIESASNDTWGDAHESAAILHKQGIRSVYVVTHAWHTRRSIEAFRDTGISVTAAPALLDSAAPLAIDFVPSAGGWWSSYSAFHEWLGRAYYALR